MDPDQTALKEAVRPEFIVFAFMVNSFVRPEVLLGLI